MSANTQDVDIVFDPKKHVYRINGKATPISVTGFISIPFREFDGVKRATDLVKYRDARYIGKTAKQIARDWIKRGQEASTLGTRLHGIIQDALDYKGWQEDDAIQPEIDQARQFISNEIHGRGIEVIETERIVFTNDDSFFVAGSIDCVCYDPKTSQYLIYDWKRIADFTTLSKFKGTFAPFTDHPDTKLVKYSIQLHLYAYILRKYHGIDVPHHNLHVVVFHRNSETYRVFKAIDMSHTIAWFVENFHFCVRHKQESRKREEVYREWAFSEDHVYNQDAHQNTMQTPIAES